MAAPCWRTAPPDFHGVKAGSRCSERPSSEVFDLFSKNHEKFSLYKKRRMEMEAERFSITA